MSYIKRFTIAFADVKDLNECFAIQAIRTGVGNDHLNTKGISKKYLQSFSFFFSIFYTKTNNFPYSSSFYIYIYIYIYIFFPPKIMEEKYSYIQLKLAFINKRERALNQGYQNQRIERLQMFLVVCGVYYSYLIVRRLNSQDFLGMSSDPELATLPNLGNTSMNY